ncbi:Rad17-domain-containing protein [Zopfia rhizophila CBS 207.26]|uniref:Rad17-domain-containing protein n=1 Tax=Zopfia rhizophila CBS 207.26 TaxID=1314779 RepID=A0A6A6E9L9_9PEZI|nr:Rad17-domain-containing protein [Zopfia rhizophila CBS 207.26]
MGKPRATRKQPIVLSSDEDEHSPPPKRPKRGTLMGISQNGTPEGSKSSGLQSRRAHSPKPPSSLSSQKSPSKSPSKPKPIYKPITSFFSNVTQTQSSQPTPSPEKPATSTPVEEKDEILDSGDEQLIKQRPGKAESINALALRKGPDIHVVSSDGPPKGSQRFLRPNGARSTTPLSQVGSSECSDNRPWNEKYGPVTLDELAVHKKKVADVRTWLLDVFNGRERKRLLLLKGPAGSGKTTTMSLLSKEMGFDMHEWKNPTNSPSLEGFVSVTAQFEDFVGRTGAFGSLAFDEPVRTRQPHPTPSVPTRQKQLILVEEFPNTFARASTAVQSFRSSVFNYLTANTPSATSFFSAQRDPDRPITPIVMIVSETLLSTSTAAADSFTAHRLLGPEILTHPGVTVIEFNPIATTFMTKALELIVLKEARKTGRRKTAGPQVIQRLSELGDIRSAVSSLEFLCVRGDEDSGWGAKVTFTKKKGPKDTPLTQMEQESLEMVTQRESTLGIFHAVGRVVHNKRIPDDFNSKTVPQPPNWFPERRRPKASEVQVDTLIDELGTDTQTFIAALHENYVLSCEGADNEETMDSIDGCIDALSNADLLSTDRFSTSGFGRRTFQGTSADNLRQDEMSFQVSVRGILYSLPSPVKRITPPTGTIGSKGRAGAKGSAFVMYYPTSLRIWRKQEEIGGLLDMWISRAQRGELFTSNTAPKAQEAKAWGVETWRKTAPFASQPSNKSLSKTTASDKPPAPVLLGSGGSARYEMLLERLPYLPLILQKPRMPSPSTASTIRDIQKIIAFTGTGFNLSAEEEQDEDEDVSERPQWSTDLPGSETPKRRKGKNMIEKIDEGSALPDVVGKDVARLVLSDDDIED